MTLPVIAIGAALFSKLRSRTIRRLKQDTYLTTTHKDDSLSWPDSYVSLEPTHYKKQADRFKEWSLASDNDIIGDLQNRDLN